MREIMMRRDTGKTGLDASQDSGAFFASRPDYSGRADGRMPSLGINCENYKIMIFSVSDKF